jgi:hypothetical protein
MGSIQHSPWIAASEGRHSPLATNVPQVAQPQQEDPKKEKRKTFLGFAMKEVRTDLANLLLTEQ